MDYLEVPVYVRINAGSSSLSRVIGYGIVWVDFTFLLDAKLSIGDDSVTDQFQRADYGLVVGGGVEIARFIVGGPVHERPGQYREGQERSGAEDADLRSDVRRAAELKRWLRGLEDGIHSRVSQFVESASTIPGRKSGRESRDGVAASNVNTTVRGGRHVLRPLSLQC